MISGGIKFFETSQNLLVDGAIISASSGQPAANYALDKNPVTYYRSVSSNDLTTETLEVTFMGDKTINRLLLLDINWKEFNVQYDLAGVWTHFTGVSGLDGAKSNVSETTFADNSAYYEMAQVTTSKIRIQVLKTQTANEQKYISQIIATSELGTLQGYPKIESPSIDRSSRVKRALGGRVNVQKSDETFGWTLNFQNYPPNLTADMDLMMELHDRETPFIVWLCGGRRGTTYFRYTLRGFRLKDAVTMQVTRSLSPSYNENVYILGLNNQIELREHV